MHASAHRSLVWPVTLCLLLSLAGCPSDPLPAVDGNPSPPPTDGSPPDTAPSDAALADAAPADAAPLSAETWRALTRDWWDAVCTRWARCSGNPRGLCGHAITTVGDPIHQWPLEQMRALGEAVARGEVDFDPDAAARCISTVRNDERCVGDWFTDAACDAAFRGRLADGMPCVVSGSCGPESYCRTDTFCAGRCTARAEQGMLCLPGESAVACADGLTCPLDRCVAPRSLDADCPWPTACEGGLVCDGTCRAPTNALPGPGEPCAPDAAYLTPLGFPSDAAFYPWTRRCAAGLRCVRGDDDDVCMQALAEGEGCDMTTLCMRGLRCIGWQTCVRRADLDAPCEHDGDCGIGLCHAGRCALRAAAGTTCADDDACGPYMTCVQGTCASEFGLACGRSSGELPAPCAADDDCNPSDAMDAACEGGVCTYMPRGVTLRITEPAYPLDDRIGALFGGWPGEAGWLLSFDGERGWLGPATADGPHPALPAVALGRGQVLRDGRFGTVQPGAQVVMRFVAEAPRGVASTTDDPCLWAVGPVALRTVLLVWRAYPEAPVVLDTGFGVRVGSDLAVGGEPLDDVMRRAGDYRDHGDWTVSLRWASAPAEPIGAPLFAADADPIDVCADP